MSREIRFRGKEIGGGWVHGNLVILGTGRVYIIPQNLIANNIPQYSVDPKTVGQYTGLKDRNGKEIYESDIVKGAHRSNEEWAQLQKVTYFNGCFMFGNWNAQEYFNKHTHIEVIGNIYDNPELLAKETNQ